VRVSLTDTLPANESPSVDMLALNEALDRLSRLDPQVARIVELRFFGGLTVEEAASALGASPAAVKRAWSMAKAWLKREMEKSDES